jgi:NTE family protein
MAAENSGIMKTQNETGQQAQALGLPKPSSITNAKPKIAIALGSGSARGWAHIGVLKALKREGIEPDIICGSSIGALVGAAYAHDHLDDLEYWVRNLSRWKLLRFLDVTFSRGAVVHAERVRRELGEVIADHQVMIEDLKKPFATVATDMMSGREIRFLHGSLHDAVLASTAIPGFLPPIFYQGRWLIDGGVVNPVPISLCRNFEPDVVLAVNLNGNIIRGPKANTKEFAGSDAESQVDAIVTPPGMFDSFAKAINIMQDRVTRSRMAGDPPDCLITPRISSIDMMEFDRSGEAIEAGEAAVERQLAEIKYILSRYEEELQKKKAP